MAYASPEASGVKGSGIAWAWKSALHVLASERVVSLLGRLFEYHHLATAFCAHIGVIGDEA